MSSYVRTSGKQSREWLFEVVKRIYGITAKERTDVDVWHPKCVLNCMTKITRAAAKLLP